MTEPQLLVCDFDGCIYPNPHNLVEILTKAVGRAGHLIADKTLSEEEAGPIGIASYYETGLSFTRLCRDFTKSLAEGFFLHHQHVHLDLQPDPDLVAALRNLDRDQVHLMILTQSSACYLDRKLKMLELDEFFPRNMRVTHDQYNFELKSKSAHGFVLAQARARMVTGIDFMPENITMFEDSADNLLIPHDMGWNTVHVHHGKPLKRKPGKDYSHIHREVNTVTEVLRDMPQCKPGGPTSDLTNGPHPV